MVQVPSVLGLVMCFLETLLLTLVLQGKNQECLMYVDTRLALDLLSLKLVHFDLEIVSVLHAINSTHSFERGQSILWQEL